MTTPPGKTDSTIGRRGITAALTAAVLLSVTGYAAVASLAKASVLVLRPVALLGDMQSEGAAKLDRLTMNTMRTAIAAEPLDQGVANVLMARDARRHRGARTPAWLAIISRLGWRDTPASQNMLYTAAMAGKMPEILDISDALLRRRQLMEQIIPVLSTVESDPTLRANLADRLAAAPSWRGAYLGTVDHLKDRSQLVGRYAFLRLLQQRGIRLDRSEVIPAINALDRAGLPQYGFALWQRVQPEVTRPLTDTRFALASRSHQVDDISVPYQWQSMSGEGFSADVSGTGDQAALSIDWSGRGVPVFAQQRTSAMPGMYGLEVEVPPGEKADLPALTFRLRCEALVTSFYPISTNPAHYVTVRSVPCSYPTLQVAGDIQSTTAAHQVTINSITMRPLGASAASR